MKRFDNRKQKILTEIFNSTQPVTGKALSLSLKVSLRTIQSEIAAINKELPLILSSNKGYQIITENYWQLSAAFPDFKENDSHAILRRLLFSNVPLQIDELAESFYFSTSSMERRLRGLKPLLEQFQLTLCRKNSCIRLMGNECDKRRLLNQLILDEINPAFQNVQNLSLYFPDLDVERIRLIILDAIHKYDCIIENAYYNNVLVNITIALYRMRFHYYVQGEVRHSELQSSTEYAIAREICHQYTLHCQISPSENDVIYLATLLEGQLKAKSSHVPSHPVPDSLSEQFVSALNQILTDVFHYYMLDIDYSDYLHGFALHVNEMLKRARNTQATSNDNLRSIKKNCPFIHDVAVSIAEKLEELYHVEISDPEIGYISIHIGYLIEAATQNSEQVSVLLVCNDYHNISERIEKNLLSDFHNLIHLQVYHPEALHTLYDIPADLIITTQPLQPAGRRLLPISPFYTDTDRAQVDEALHTCLREKHLLRISRLFASFSNENLFFKTDDFHSKEEVIRFLGQAATDFGLVDQDFTDSVLKRERISSTCFFDTFAIPHAIEMNAKKTMVCILVSPKGIAWNENLIHIVLMITVHPSDRKKFMELYNGIVRTLERPDKVQQLIAAETYSDFIHTLISLEPVFSA